MELRPDKSLSVILNALWILLLCIGNLWLKIYKLFSSKASLNCSHPSPLFLLYKSEVSEQMRISSLILLFAFSTLQF